VLQAAGRGHHYQMDATYLGGGSAAEKLTRVRPAVQDITPRGPPATAEIRIRPTAPRRSPFEPTVTSLILRRISLRHERTRRPNSAAPWLTRRRGSWRSAHRLVGVWPPRGGYWHMDWLAAAHAHCPRSERFLRSTRPRYNQCGRHVDVVRAVALIPPVIVPRPCPCPLKRGKGALDFFDRCSQRAHNFRAGAALIPLPRLTGARRACMP